MFLVIVTITLTNIEKACFKSPAEIYDLSQCFKRMYECHANRLNRAIGRSLRSLRIQVGSVYFIKMSTFKTFMASIVDNTITILITFF